jgi:hypothetical protein
MNRTPTFFEFEIAAGGTQYYLSATLAMTLTGEPALVKTGDACPTFYILLD